jgi:hypothetical protein
VPLDERLQLPQGKSSYLLQDWHQALAVEMPYATVSATLARTLGFSPNRCIPWNATSARWPRWLRISGKIARSRRRSRKGRSWCARPTARGVPTRGGAKAPAGIEPPSTGGVRPGTVC